MSKFEVKIAAHRTDILSVIVEAESVFGAEEKVKAALLQLDPMADVREASELVIDRETVPMEFIEVDLDDDTWDLTTTPIEEAE